MVLQFLFSMQQILIVIHDFFSSVSKDLLFIYDLNWFQILQNFRIFFYIEKQLNTLSLFLSSFMIVMSCSAHVQKHVPKCAFAAI